MRGSRLHGNDGGVVRSGEPLNSVAFGCISLHSYQLRGDGAGMRGSRLHGNDGGVARSDETFNSVAFGCISLHSCPPNPHPRLLPEGEGTCRRPGCAVPVYTGPLEAPCPRPEHPHPMLRIDLSPIQGEVNTCLRGSDGGIRGNDSCRQCRGWRSGGAMGSCREVERLGTRLGAT